MKRKKVIIAVLTLAAVFMGTGYGYWTQGMKSKSTMSTAKFDVYIDGQRVDVNPIYGTDDDKKLSQTIKNQVLKGTPQKYGIGSEVFKLREVDLDINKIYPGAGVELKTVIVNESTIDVKPTPEVSLVEGSIEEYSDLIKFYIGGSYTPLNYKQLSDELSKITLSKGKEYPLCIKAEIADTVTNKAMCGKMVGIKIVMNWQQA